VGRPKAVKVNRLQAVTAGLGRQRSQRRSPKLRPVIAAIWQELPPGPAEADLTDKSS
jgi:hypothetical protein